MIVHLIIVHESVEGLYPHRVDVSVKHNPARSVAGRVDLLSHDVGEQTCEAGACYGDTDTGCTRGEGMLQ